MSMLNEESACGRGTRSGSAAGAATLVGRARSYLGLLLGVVLRVGVDDVTHQLVTDNVGGAQSAEVHVLDAVAELLPDAQPALGAARQVGLGHVPGDDYLRAEPESGEEHLHLLRG